MTRLRRARLALLGALLLWPAPAAAQGAPSPALASYVQGLDALRNGRYDEAIAALGRAMQTAPDPSFVLARGVAQCLAEKPREAIADFEQAKRAGRRGREADLWTYTAQMMSGGRERSGLDNRGRGGQGWFGGAPGHVIQGRDDYPTDYASFVYYEMATPYAKGVTPAVRQAQGVTAESFIELVKAALAHGDCQAAAQTMSRATEARFPPEKREEANRLQFEIARCFQSRR